MEGYATQTIGIVELTSSVGVKALLAENSPIEGPPTEIKVLKGALGPLAGVGMGMMPAPSRVAKKGGDTKNRQHCGAAKPIEAGVCSRCESATYVLPFLVGAYGSNAITH